MHCWVLWSSGYYKHTLMTIEILANEHFNDWLNSYMLDKIIEKKGNLNKNILTQSESR